MKSSNLLLLIIFSVFTIACKAQLEIDSTRKNKIEELVDLYAKYGKFNGSILVSKSGDVIFKKGYGSANMEWDIPNQTDTKFRIASVTKQFTAMLIMQMVAEAKLALDVPISTYLPTFPKEKGDKINIHHLLTHSSGVPNYTSFSNYREVMRDPLKPIEIIEIFADSLLQFSPGERFSYSNSGYVLLGNIIEEVSGKSFEEVLKEKILIPLKMTNSGVDNHRNIIKNRAVGYNRNGSTFVNSSYIDMSVAYTAGAIFSTVEDLYLWDQALYTEALLPKKFMALIFDKQIPAWRQHYGYGWNIGESPIGNTDEVLQTVKHNGGINGFNSSILRMPSDHSSIIMLNNTSGTPHYDISKAINGILNNKPYDLPKKSIAHSLVEIIDTEGLEKGLIFYQKVKDDDNYYLDEQELNMASYEMLHSDRASLAADILELGIEAFPNAFNLYDSYGEVLMTLGKNTESIKNYKKSLTLNPKNENGIKMLKKLGVEINAEDLYLLLSDSSWTKEILPFPLHFAEELNFKGHEEAQFPKGWRDPESPEYWSYIFAWNIENYTSMSVTELQSKLQIYFDGLMNVVNKNKSIELPKSIASLYKSEAIDRIPKYSGTIKTFDSFVKNEMMTLNVTAEIHDCEDLTKSIVLFRFSPQKIGNDIWLELNKLKLRENYCKE